jgi:[acyl-carrier-protein] S-malonyltransferase
MQDAAEQSDTSMAAVLGGDRETVLAHLQSLNVVAANENGAGQIVAAGSSAHIATLLEQPPSGARVRALSVAGAFHTNFMKSAQGPVETIANSLQLSDPKFRVLSNQEGAIIASGEDLVQRIVTQITNPVRWDLCMETMQREGVTGLLELFPGGTLTSIAKRAMNNIETFAIISPETLTDAVEFAHRHTSGEQ